MFGVICLDQRHRVLGFSELFNGTIDGASVYPREVFVLDIGAKAVLLIHNHSSKICEPSQADINITGKLSEALALIDVRVLDHLICGGTNITSVAERGLM